ncbi:MAG: hypothetical protein GZ089_02510 [Aromatoleum sp.]|nr:hypothetical protein [Aromatoleum sp.]
MLDLFPTMSGMATSLQRFVRFTLSAVNAVTIAPFRARSLKAPALGMARFTLGSYALRIVCRRRSRDDLGNWKP